MGNYSSAVVTMVPGSDGLPEGTQVYRARVTTPPAWRRSRSTARSRPVISAPIPLAPIEEDDETSSSVAGGRRRTLQAGEEDYDSIEEVFGGLERLLGRHQFGALSEARGDGDAGRRDAGRREGPFSRTEAFRRDMDDIERDFDELYGAARESEDLCDSGRGADDIRGARRNSADSEELFGAERGCIDPWDTTEQEPGAGDEERCSLEPGTVERAAWVSRVTDEPVPRDASSERSDGGGGGETRRGRLFVVQGTETRRRYRSNRRLTAEQRRRALRDPDDDGDGDDWSGSGRRRRGEPGHLLVRHRRERRQAAHSLARDAVKRWYLPWLRDGYLASGDEEEPPPPDDSDDDTRSLRYIAAQRAAAETAEQEARARHWKTHSARYAAHAMIELHPDDPTGDPTLTSTLTSALTSELTSELTEVILGRGRSPETVCCEAGLMDTHSELCKEHCIDRYLEVYCSDSAPTPRRAASHQDAAQLRRSLWLSSGALNGAIENALQAMDKSRLVEACLLLQSSHQVLRQRGAGLRSQVAGLSGAGDALETQASQLRVKLKASEAEVALTKEALAALKADRKRLKAEKFDLLNQMKQLYQTLEDKERELRDFIRNYELRIKENDESLRTLAAERDETEREKWNILKHARDETERSVGLSAELSNKDGQLKHITEELTGLSQLGYYSDHDSAKPPVSRGGPPPAAPSLSPAAAPALSPAALGTPNGRGSSADSGVRVSSDRESVAAGGGTGAGGTSGNLSDSTTSGDGTTGYCVTACAGVPTAGGGAGDPVPTDYDSISMVSSATACSPYYYYTPAVDGQRGSPTMSPLTLSHAVDLSAISKSAEQLDSLDQLDRKLRPKAGAKQGTWGSISRVFSRQKQRKQLHMGSHTNDDSWSPHSSLCSSPLTDESYAEKLRLLEEAQQLPMERWKASMVLAWLQVTLGMPQYGPACAENVRSGKVMLELTDVDLERCLGIQQPMHKKKLRLAIEELRQPHLCKYPYISQLNHGWVAAEWLPDIGLAQYAELFSAHLMDGRMLAHLTKKDMERYLNVTRKFHQVSMMHGIQLLRLLQFDRQIICERRQRSELTGNDVLVWTNARFVHWARSIDLAEYADNLKDSGVHGALVVLELSFTADTMATALGVPQSKSMIRRHLAAEMDKLVRPARALLDEEARYTRWEQERRRQERQQERGSGAGSATLGRPFSRSYASGLQRSSDKEKRGSSLRNMQLQFMHKKPSAWPSSQGSLSRAFGLKARQEQQAREPVYETPRGVPVTAAAAAAGAGAGGRPAPPPDRPQSVVTASSCETQREKQHRRVKSISDMETLTVTPV
ncbi:liprin-alpha-1-like isoform X6 [Amphibalanus amphitrite]|uniref:liprin-alpha-1-like isoform X6 n=1 Tax=Amphibalanus amphitrite TaxID=1232801 RepID=UPI001C905CA6|nr:liprin-alpha-1-like isoform X6 [Amphibalanus amphitrite]